jgi:glucosamine-6-phosphate deaminase
MVCTGKYPGWWDWTGFAAENPEMMARIRALTLEDMAKLSRPGFKVRVFANAQEFFLAEALEYIEPWQRATADNPVMVCGPVGPVEQLPLVAEIINTLRLDVRHGHFAGMDEFVENGKAIPVDHPLSFAKTDRELCFDRIDSRLRMPDSHLHFPTEDTGSYSQVWDDPNMKVAVTQGGQGNTKHFAFNDPLRAEGVFTDRPPTVDEYRNLRTRLVDLHPATIVQDARHSTAGEEWLIPSQAVTVGPAEVLGRSDCISIWHPGHHDNGFGIRLTAWMLANMIMDARVPMSLLALHHNVKFNLLGPCIPPAGLDMH